MSNPGTYTLRVFTDYNELVSESNEANNQASLSYSVAGPDLTILGIAVTPFNGTAHTAGTLTVTVANIGSAMPSA